MRVRNTIAAVVVLAGLIAFIYYYEYRGEESREAARRVEENVFPYERETIDRVEIARGDAPTLILQKSEDEWRISNPIDTLADPDGVRSLLSSLGFLRIERRLTEVAADQLQHYGLSPPTADVLVHGGGGGALGGETRVLIGGGTPVGGNHYLSRPESTEVLVVSGGVEPLISAGSDTLRLKKLVGIDSWRIDHVRIEKQGEAVTVERGERGWRLTEPIDFPADEAKVDALASDLQSVQAEGFESESPDPVELERFGLGSPELSVTVKAEDATREVTIDLGRPPGSEEVFATRTGMKAVMNLGSEIYVKLSAAVNDPLGLRDARVAPFDRFRLSRLELARDGETIALLKDEESRWRWGAEEGPALESEDVNGILDAIEALRASRFVDGEPGAAQNEPEVTLRLFEGEGEDAREWSVLVPPASDTADDLRAVRSSAADSVYLVPGVDVSALLEKIESLEAPEENP